MTDEQKAKLMEHSKECVSSTGVNEELIVKAKKGEFSDDPKLQDYVFCMLKKIGVVNDQGEPQLDVIKQKMHDDINPEETAKVIEACKEKKGGSPAETAYMVFQCYYKSSPNHLSLA